MDQETQIETSAPSAASSKATDQKVCIVSYCLMLATPLLWFTPFVALVISYVSRGDADDMVKSHYGNIIGTFWTSFMVTTVAVLLYAILFMFMLSGVGFGSTMLVSAGMLALTIWVYVRMIKGLIRLLKARPCA